MIIIFSSNEGGGVLQFVSQALRELVKLNKEVVCFIPEGAVISIPQDLMDRVEWYKKTKKINIFNSSIRSLSQRVLSFTPSFLWVFDDSVVSSQLIINLRGKIRMAMIMHDAGTVHGSYKSSLLSVAKRFYEEKLSIYSNKIVEKIIVLSPESKKTYCSLFPHFSNKVFLLPLGAHVPECTPECPPELINCMDYFLFFGRLDKYKGIDILVQSYKLYKEDKKLIIAGAGVLDEREQDLIHCDDRIMLIKRYISDSEMIYLFKHMISVVLPYKEATQSGIIPIAYLYGKPVVCSNIPGLTQFVKDGVTGIVCHSINDYVNAYQRLGDAAYSSRIGRQANDYYLNNLDWNANIKNMLEEMQL